MKVGPHVMTHSHSNQHHHEREVVPRVGSAQVGGSLKLIQCQLMLLLHARRCQQRHELMLASNRQQAVPNSMARALLLNCPVRHCRAFHEVLNHMKTCRLGATCTYQHCTTSLRILSHWTNCTIEDCPLCQCVRQRMQRAKEWEATLPRSSRYTLLAAALRSSQTPQPVPPNCQVAEQAQEGQSGVPCQSQDELRSCPVASPNLENVEQLFQQQESPQGTNSMDCDKKANNANVVIDKSFKDGSPAGPSFDQVRKAYEQLGIPCPEEALKRLMATLPSSSSPSSRRAQRQNEDGSWKESHHKSSKISRLDQQQQQQEGNNPNFDPGVFDCSSSEPSPSSSTSDSESESRQSQSLLSFQQHPLISSTTAGTLSSQRLTNKSSSSRPN